MDPNHLHRFMSLAAITFGLPPRDHCIVLPPNVVRFPRVTAKPPVVASGRTDNFCQIKMMR